MSYDTIGAYRSGAWLVWKGDKLAIADRASLPPEGKGFHYYWLGNSQRQVNQRADTALINTGWAAVKVAPLDVQNWAQEVFAHGGSYGITPRDTGQSIIQMFAYGAAGAGALAAAIKGAEAVGGSAAAAAGAGAAGKSAASKAGSKVGSTLLKDAGGTLLKGAAALSVGELFTKMGLWQGLGMILAGAVLILIGILNLAGVDPGGIGATAKRVVG